MGGTLEFYFKEGYPSVVNNREIVEIVRKSTEEFYLKNDLDKYLTLDANITTSLTIMADAALKYLNKN